MEKLQNILSAFGIDTDFLKYEQINTGHINDTYKIYSDNLAYILQKINTDVFKEPEKVMHNIDIAQTVLKKNMKSAGKSLSGKIPLYLKAGTQNYLIDNGFWRIYPFIDGTSANQETAFIYEFGKLLGEFHKFTKNTDSSKLYVTIPDFNNIEKNIAALLKYKDSFIESAIFFENFLDFYTSIKSKLSPKRLVHNDVKLANVLINPVTRIPEALIDFDTVMEGYAAFDFGDAVRSACISADKIIDKEKLYDFSKGYFSNYNVLSADECTLGILSIATELSARYLFDCLSNANVFKNLTYDEKNQRHKQLLTFAENIFRDFDDIKKIIENAKIECQE